MGGSEGRRGLLSSCEGRRGLSRRRGLSIQSKAIPSRLSGEAGGPGPPQKPCRRARQPIAFSSSVCCCQDGVHMEEYECRQFCRSRPENTGGLNRPGAGEKKEDQAHFRDLCGAAVQQLIVPCSTNC